MKCCRCKINEAVINVKQINDGMLDDLDLCQDCYEEIYKLNNVDDTANVPNTINNQICDYCGKSLKEILDSAYVGCAYCYEKYYDDLKNIINNYQKGVTK